MSEDSQNLLHHRHPVQVQDTASDFEHIPPPPLIGSGVSASTADELELVNLERISCFCSMVVTSTVDEKCVANDHTRGALPP